MLILSIEQSSDTGSIAILNDEKILGEREWSSLALRSCGLFACLKDLLAATGLNLKDISRYVVDVGPGSYSGLRSSFAAVRAFALPENQPIYALKSAEAIAFEIMNEYSADKVQVVGDARRRQLWHCVYGNNDGRPVVQADLSLSPENDFCPAPGAVIVSPDWQRLNGKLTAMVAAKARLIKEVCIPKAAQLGRLAYRKICLQAPSEPLKIIYLHAAVDGVKKEVRMRN